MYTFFAAQPQNKHFVLLRLNQADLELNNTKAFGVL